MNFIKVLLTTFAKKSVNVVAEILNYEYYQFFILFKKFLVHLKAFLTQFYFQFNGKRRKQYLFTKMCVFNIF